MIVPDRGGEPPPEGGWTLLCVCIFVFQFSSPVSLVHLEWSTKFAVEKDSLLSTLFALYFGAVTTRAIEISTSSQDHFSYSKQITRKRRERLPGLVYTKF